MLGNSGPGEAAIASSRAILGVYPPGLVLAGRWLKAITPAALWNPTQTPPGAWTPQTVPQNG